MENKQLIPLSIREAFADQTIFVIGATGFLGKVWLTQLLCQVQSLRKIYILIRAKGSQSAQERFEQMINTSYVFEPLHKKFREDLSTYLRGKIEIVEGDVSEENLGLGEKAVEKLAKQVDITVNFAGLVDFNPQLNDAFSTNVQGAIIAAEFVRKCKSKKLVHVSTCYVAGTREGEIQEKINSDRTPNGTPLDADREIQWIKSNLAETMQAIDSPEQLADLSAMIETRHTELHKEMYSEKKLKKTIEHMKRRRLRDNLTQLGMNRAKSLGWTNTYTYTKNLAEIILKQNYADIELVIFRPSIVESSFSFPFAGWNEGFNTSGPLAYLMKTWFRHLPLKKGNPFDVIPVDYVARGLSIASAALLRRVHREVYQCATSNKNQLTIEKACEYTSDSHSIFFRRHGDDWREKYILSRWKTIPSRKDHPLSSQRLKPAFSKLEKLSSALANVKLIGRPFKPVHRWFLKINRKLEQIDKLLELFYPFIHDYHHVFVTESLFMYDVKEPELAFDIQKINWRDYWIHTQMPGLRRWCFPVIEGRSVEKYVTRFPVTLVKHSLNGSTNGKDKSDAPKQRIRHDLRASALFEAESKKVTE